MRTTILLACLCWAAGALASPVDPADDHIGVYFDAGATIADYTSTPGVPFTAYVVVTNPTANAVQGVEFGYQFVVPAGYESSFARLGQSPAAQSVDCGDSADPAQGDYILGLADPLPPAEALVLVSWDLVLHDDFPMDIYLGPASPQSIEDDLPGYLAGQTLFPAGLSSGSLDVPVARINGGVSDVPARDFRDAVVLEPCHPNPFNPRTTIRYSLPRAAAVRLLIHDVGGKVVRELVDGRSVGPGPHQEVWDGRDAAGRAVASGVYFCRIEALGAVESRRMTLVR